MGWRTVVVEQHSKISYSGRRILVQTNEDIHEIPIDDIGTLIVGTTSAVITSRALSELANQEAKVVFTGTHGEPTCETVGYLPSNRTRTKLEKQFNWEDQRKEVLWTWIATAKMALQIDVLDYLHIDSEALRYEFAKIEMNDGTNREAVVAREYFQRLFNRKFNRRTFDPYNAALNYGYSILLSTVNREIASAGNLTQLGIHHRSDENQFNLGSDLMEPFRPVFDCWIAQQTIKEMTPELKVGLVRLLNLEIEFNGKHVLLQNAIKEYVNNCLKYLDGEKDEVKIEVKLGDEVSNNEINGNV